MTWLIILRPPGGASGVAHRRYAAREKIAIVLKICWLKQENICSYRQAAAMVSVSHTLVFRWYAIRERYNNIDIKILPCYLWSTWECEWRDTRMDFWEEGDGASCINSLHHHQSLLPPASHAAEVSPCVLFGDAPLQKKNSFVHHMGTKVSQHPPSEVCQEAMEFQDFIRPMLRGPERDLCWIINIDQKLVFFSMEPKKPLTILCKKSVIIRTSTNDTRRATVALTITAADSQLVPMVVYKGTENGTIN